MTIATWRGSGRSTRLFAPIASLTRSWYQVRAAEPVPDVRKKEWWSGRRASNPLPRPWQGRALPSELLPLGQREDHTLARPAGRLDPACFRFEDFFDSPFERPRQGECQRETWVVLASLDRVHRLARNAQPLRKVRLRPVQLSAQDSQPILHRYRQLKIAAPTPQSTAISGRT